MNNDDALACYSPTEDGKLKFTGMELRRTAAISFSLMGGTAYYIHSNSPFAPHRITADINEATALLPGHADDIKKYGVKVVVAGSVIRIDSPRINVILHKAWG